MTDCQAVRKLLVLYAEGELSAGERRQVRDHLAQCESCREEAAGIDEIRSWLLAPDLFLPRGHSWQFLPRALVARAKELAPARKWVPSNYGTPGWVVTLAASLAIGFAWIQMVPERAAPPVPRVAGGAPGPAAFVRRMESVFAREATARYLDECQDLLLNLVRAERRCAGDGHDVSAEVGRARELLQRKRMLDMELRKPEVARAKELCDELEHLLVNLSAAEQCESPDQLRLLEGFIQRQQILLRINLLRTELS